MKRFVFVIILLLLVAACATDDSVETQDTEKQDSQNTHEQEAPPQKHEPAITGETTDASLYSFTADSGIRMDEASNPGARTEEDGSVTLLYEGRRDTPSGKWQVNAADGLTFSRDDAIEGNAMYFHAIELPDGTWRAYGGDPTKGTIGFGSSSSDDGETFTEDEGTRYELHESDNGKMGVFDYFLDSNEGVVLLYLGDMYGLNNIRRAYSEDWWTFTYDRGNILGDDEAGGGSWSFVDIDTIRVDEDTIYLIAMRNGEIYSFVSHDDGYSFTREPDVLLVPEDFDGVEGYSYVSLHDPQIVYLEDGHLRIYVTAKIAGEGEGPDSHQVIVSATSQ